MRLWTIHNWQLLKGPFTVRAFLACSQIQAMIIHYHTPYNDLLAKYTDESYPGKEPGEALSLRSLPTIQKSKFLLIINDNSDWLLLVFIWSFYTKISVPSTCKTIYISCFHNLV